MLACLVVPPFKTKKLKVNEEELSGSWNLLWMESIPHKSYAITTTPVNGASYNLTRVTTYPKLKPETNGSLPQTTTDQPVLSTKIPETTAHTPQKSRRRHRLKTLPACKCQCSGRTCISELLRRIAQTTLTNTTNMKELLALGIDGATRFRFLSLKSLLLAM
eukprot:505572-Amphidinium_carterae.3